MLGLGDGAGGGEGGGVGGGGWWELQQRHGGLRNDNEAISRAWKCLFLWRISIVGGASKQEEAREKMKERNKKAVGRGGGRVFKRFRSHIISKSRIWSTLMFATWCVILRSRVIIIYIGACYTRGAGSRRSCGVWGRRGRWRGGRGDEYIYIYISLLHTCSWFLCPAELKQ